MVVLYCAFCKGPILARHTRSKCKPIIHVNKPLGIVLRFCSLECKHRWLRKKK
ncbi:MAG: hypothetical protein HWN65_23095 [Candidatus Helarchaeota archaeon]|nr:hypothetical protein [Candidatus Helarchaeota archaeon]